MTATRWTAGGVGVLTGVYGAWLLLDGLDGAQLAALARWSIGGVVVHDVAVAGLALVAGALVSRVVPGPARAPVAVGAIVLATVTAAAVPVLLALGRRDDNPTVLDRDYGTGWLVLAGLVLAAVAGATAVSVRRGRTRTDPDRPGPTRTDPD